jgi:TRAP-type transport system small permease protein
MTNRAMDKILKYGTLLFTLAFIASVLLQIFARFLLSSAPSWTEESSRLFFIYAIACAAGIALKDGYYVSIEYFINLFPERLKDLLKKAMLGMNVLLFAAITIYTFQFVQIGVHEHSPSMGISMSFAFFSMVILFGSLCLYSIREFFDKIK